MEVETSAHAWLDSYNFQRKQLLAPNEYFQHNPLCTEDSGTAGENLNDPRNFLKWQRRNDIVFLLRWFFNPTMFW